MMINPRRGEVAIVIDGQERVMRLSLGALAALEEKLGATSLLEVVRAFEEGSFRSNDLLALIWAGLNGGGWDIDLAEVGRCSVDGGPLAAAKAGARLLAVTFAEAAP